MAHQIQGGGVDGGLGFMPIGIAVAGRLAAPMAEMGGGPLGCVGRLVLAALEPVACCRPPGAFVGLINRGFFGLAFGLVSLLGPFGYGSRLNFSEYIFKFVSMI